MIEIVEAFQEHDLEINISDLHLDGNIHRFKGDRNDYKKSGWYVGFQNHMQTSGEIYYVVVFGDWRNPQGENWTYKSNRKYNAFDRKAIDVQLKKAKKKSEEERFTVQSEAAKECQEKWNRLQIDPGNAVLEYLEKKQIKPCEELGIKYDTFINSIFIPIKDMEGKIWSIEEIKYDGAKQFHPGGRKGNCFHIIGEIGSTDRLYFTEGFATAASIFLATKNPVVCAFDAGNLGKVVGEFRKCFPERQFTICGDDDQHKNPNTGRLTAENCAKEYAASAIFPKFKSLEGNPTDWNDLHCREGIEEVKKQILGSNLVVAAEKIAHVSVMQVGYPDEDEATGKKLGTIENVKEMISRLGIICRYNVISKNEEILIPDATFSIDNKQNASIAEVKSWCRRVKIPVDDLNGILLHICDKNQFNPVVTWIESKPWDGISRLDKFCSSVKAKGETTDTAEGVLIKTMKEDFIKVWMAAAVAAAYSHDGFRVHGVLVFQGDQYLGKTTWFKSLVPERLGLTASGMSLNPDNKDSVLQCASHWLVELGELDATLKSDVAKLKAFFDRSRDILRPPYAAKTSEYARRTAFFASVNELHFLKDETGNRRFYVVECESIEPIKDENFMQQVWAEILHLLKKGAKTQFSQSEVTCINAHNQKFLGTNPVEESILTHYDWTSKNPSPNWKTATQVCQAIGICEPRRNHTNVAARILRAMTLSPISMAKGVTRYDVPIKTNIKGF